VSSLFSGLNIARSALAAQTQVLDVTAHNVANANTPGYTKQTVLLTSAGADGYQGAGITIGDGVRAQLAPRTRTAMYDEIFRRETQNFSADKKTADLLNQVEAIFNEPSDQGLSAVIDQFFNGWQEAANAPQNMAARENLKVIGNELTDRLHLINSNLMDIKNSVDSEISAIPTRINQITEQIASLNTSISNFETQGETSSELRDRRDTLVDELSGLVDVRTVEQSDSSFTVMVGQIVVVEHDSQTSLQPVYAALGENNAGKLVIRSEEGNDYTPGSGELGALLTLRDNGLASVMDKMNEFASALVDGVNAQHKEGYGLDGLNGRNFFDPSKNKASNITLSDDIRNSSNIAVSGDGSKGDNSNALLMGDIKQQKLFENRYSLSDFYNSIVSDIGFMAQKAQNGRTNGELLINQIDTARQNIKGVNIDEELITMIQSQHIYQSASKLISTLDSLLQTLIGM
jgi:flagellar hook-associated protein 1